MTAGVLALLMANTLLFGASLGAALVAGLSDMPIRSFVVSAAFALIGLVALLPRLSLP